MKTFSHIDIDRLEADVIFGSAISSGTWPVSQHSTGAYGIEVTKSQSGQNMVWDIPFDINDTIPSPSGRSGVRKLTKILDATEVKPRPQFATLAEFEQYLQSSSDKPDT